MCSTEQSSIFVVLGLKSSLQMSRVQNFQHPPLCPCAIQPFEGEGLQERGLLVPLFQTKSEIENRSQGFRNSPPWTGLSPLIGWTV